MMAPSTAGIGGILNSKPNPCINAAGSVRRTRSSRVGTFRLAARVAPACIPDRQIGNATRADRIEQIKHDVALAGDGRAVDGQDLIARTQPAVRGNGIRHHIADDGFEFGDAGDPEHAPQHEDREHDVECGTGQQHGNALPGRLTGEGARQVFAAARDLRAHRAS